VPYFLFLPQAELLRSHGFQSLAHVPCVFGGEWEYARVPSRYLRERAMGETNDRRRRFPTAQSIATFGRHLTNFLEWCDARRKTWQDLEYKADLIDGYQREMLCGEWAVGKRSLGKTTVNSRVDEACNFLLWATKCGLREEFKVLSYRQNYTSGSAVSARGHESQQIEARVGRVRPDPMKMDLPSAETVTNWLNSVRIEKGETKALMCELILRTGIRREECVQWRHDTVPKNPDRWRRSGRMITVTVEYGTKGQKSFDPIGGEKGPVRQILLPVDLAERLHTYSTITRAERRSRFVKAGKGKAEQRRRFENNPHQLFLSEETGEPVTASSLYRAWTTASANFEGWSPHPGRHYWACQTLLDDLQIQQRGRQADAMPTNAWIYGSAMDVVLLKLQPQLGHIDKKTTLRYVAWACRALGMDVEADDWWTRHLEAEMDNDEARADG
jgi:integrase